MLIQDYLDNFGEQTEERHPYYDEQERKAWAMIKCQAVFWLAVAVMVIVALTVRGCIFELRAV